MLQLTVENVSRIMKECLYKEDEPITSPTVVHGVVRTFGFNPAKLQLHKKEISEMLDYLPETFHESTGGGWSFLNACMTKDGKQWGEQPNVEELMVLGMAINKVNLLMPHDLWHLLPGGMPYFSVKA